MKRYQLLAKEHSIWLSLGGFQEAGPDPDRIHNTHVIIDSEGQIVTHYRKVR